MTGGMNMQISSVISKYDDGSVVPRKISQQQRAENADVVIQRFFVDECNDETLTREALIRNINPGPDFYARFQEQEQLADGGFGPELAAPSALVVDSFRVYAQTDLGAVALARLLEWDDQYIALGWRTNSGTLTESGIHAYAQGKWRPFRVASCADGPDRVTPSGALLLPDRFIQEWYSTGDIAHPLAVLHHELKAHVLPMREARGLVHGRAMALICLGLESEMLSELDLPVRRLEWGRDDSTLDQTLYEPTEQMFHGLVRCDDAGELVEINPDNDVVIGKARVLQV